MKQTVLEVFGLNPVNGRTKGVLGLQPAPHAAELNGYVQTVQDKQASYFNVQNLITTSETRRLQVIQDVQFKAQPAYKIHIKSLLYRVFILSRDCSP